MYQRSKTSKCAAIGDDGPAKGKLVNPKEFIFENLEEKGRLQFFYHLPGSRLPVRDVMYKGKTEPHIEIGAENYINCCYQPNNIVPFLKSKEKYLFLFTTCRNKEFYGKKFIVGYIVKQEFIFVNHETVCGCEKPHFAVRGETKIFGFEDAYPLDKLLKNSNMVRLRKIDEHETRKILEHFRNKRNIMTECVEEIKQKDRENKTCRVICKFRDACLRYQ